MERKTMGRIMIAVAMVMSAVMAGCGGVGSTLERAEAVIDSMPDSALALLSTLDVARLDGGDKAWYALLQSKALDKSYIDVRDDSLIVQAVRYYDGDGSDHEMQAHYYRGVVIKNGGDARAAIVEFRKAEHLAAALHNDLYYAKSNEMLADIYYRSYNMERSIMHRMCAIDGYRKVGRRVNEQYAIVDLACSYGNWYKNERCVAILDSLDDSGLYNDSIFKAYFYETYIRPYLGMKEYGKAVEKIDKMFENQRHDLIKHSDFALISRVYYGLGDMDKYLYYHNLAKQQPGSDDDVIICKNEFFIAKEKGQYELAIERLQRVLHIVDSTSCVTLQQSTALADRDYSEKQYLYYEGLSNLYKLCIILGGASFITIVIVIILTFIRKIARKRELYNTQMSDLRCELETLTTDNSLYQQQLESANKELSQQKLLTNKILKSQFETLNRLSHDYFEHDKSDQIRRAIIKEYEKELTRIKSPKNMEDIRKTVNICFNNVVDVLINHNIVKKPEDIDFVVLKIAGLSPRTICLLMNMKLGNYYVKSERIRTRIENSDISFKQDIVAMLK